MLKDIRKEFEMLGDGNQDKDKDSIKVADWNNIVPLDESVVGEKESDAISTNESDEIQEDESNSGPIMELEFDLQKELKTVEDMEQTRWIIMK